MTTYEDAVTCILDAVHTMPAEERVLAECLGQVTAEDVYSSLTLPQRATAGPDGYAAKSAEIASASHESPVQLRICEAIRAGVSPRRRVESGTVSRVMTGSVMPEGADCVVRFEDTDEPSEKNGPNPSSPQSVRIFVPVLAGAGTLPAGSAVKRGDLLVPHGTVIGPGQISALLASGIRSVKVFRRPVVAIICTGDELISGPGPLMPAKTFNSNGPTVAALVKHHGGVPKSLGIARDNRASLERKFALGMRADAIITSGGVSKGDFDLVRLVLGASGRVCFSRIQMGPGLSVSFGVAVSKTEKGECEVPVFALAGPPAGCLINFETLVRPALRKFLGYSNLLHPEVNAVAIDAVANKAPFNFVRWTKLSRTADGYRVEFKPIGGPGNLTNLATSNSLTILPRGARIEPGDTVKVLPLDWGL